MKPAWLSAIFLTAGVLSAQIAYVEGNVYVDTQRVERADPKSPLQPGSVVRTEKGRAEIHFDRGDMLFLDANSSVRSGPAGLEILSGSAVVITGEIGPAIGCRGTVHLSDAGVFRFDVHRVVDENDCRVRVYMGAAAAPMQSFTWVLTPGKMIDLGSCGDHTPRNEFDIKDTDDLNRWSLERAGVRP
jgi:hypothetical protein